MIKWNRRRILKPHLGAEAGGCAAAQGLRFVTHINHSSSSADASLVIVSTLSIFFHIVFIAAINHALHFLTFLTYSGKQKRKFLFDFSFCALYPLVVISLHTHFK